MYAYTVFGNTFDVARQMNVIPVTIPVAIDCEDADTADVQITGRHKHFVLHS